MTDRQTGVVKWYSDLKGYGFIAVDGRSDIFLHARALVGVTEVQAGQPVEFDVVEHVRGLRAASVSVLPAAAV